MDMNTKTRLLQVGLRVGPGHNDRSLYVTLPRLEPLTNGCSFRTEQTEANGLVYPLGRCWEVFRHQPRGEELRALFARILPGWREVHAPTFSDLVKTPERVKEFYSPKDLGDSN